MFEIPSSVIVDCMGSMPSTRNCFGMHDSSKLTIVQVANCWQMASWLPFEGWSLLRLWKAKVVAKA